MTSEIVILITELRNKQRITLPAGSVMRCLLRSSVIKITISLVMAPPLPVELRAAERHKFHRCTAHAQRLAAGERLGREHRVPAQIAQLLRRAGQ